MTIRAIVFDASETLVAANGKPAPGVVEAISKLRGDGIKVAVVANDKTATLQQRLDAAGICYDLAVGRDVAGARKPSARFVQVVAAKFGTAGNEMLYVGDNDATDAFLAVNARVLYLAATWANPAAAYGMPVADPPALLRFVYRFMRSEPMWYWSLDQLDSLKRPVRVLALLPASKGANQPLRDVLKLDSPIRQEGLDYRAFVYRRMLTVLYLSGELADIDTWTWYPSHTGSPRPRQHKYVQEAARLFRDAHSPDLLVRHKESTKLAYARFNHVSVGFDTQLSTVHLNPARRGHVDKKHVLVLDDFCTAGLSFECARNLLYAGGARRVTCVAFGRYRDDYGVFTPNQGVTVNPWAPLKLSAADFGEVTVRGSRRDEAALEVTRLVKMTPPGSLVPTTTGGGHLSR